MNDFIIEIDGIKITWYKEFIESGCKKIALRFSGGVDSTLVLWLLCYFLDKAKIYDVEIYNYYLRDCSRSIPSKSEPLRKIINHIQSQFPKINLKPMDVAVYWFVSSWDRKKENVYLEQAAVKKEKWMREKYGVDWFINGINLGYTEKEFIELGIPKEVYDTRDDRRDPSRMLTGIDTHDNVTKRAPLYNVNKSLVKKLYERYDLIDTLYPMTISCMSYKYPFPCKTCFWCVEKYAVFGTYDIILK
jgi:hypothetical protein